MEHARCLFHGFKCRVHWGDITDPKFCDEILSDLIKALNKMEPSEEKEYLLNEIQTLLGILRDEGFPFLQRCIELEFNSTLHIRLEDIIAQRMALDAISPKEMMLRYLQISEPLIDFVEDKRTNAALKAAYENLKKRYQR